jgi:hypothetical protein
MASAVPVKDLRRLAAWADELGFDRLKADLIDGDLVAWWQHPTTGEWHEIPRAYWEEEGAVKRAAGGWGWPLGGLFSSDFRSAAIYAARGPSKGAKQPKQSRQSKQRNKPAQEEVLRRVHDAYPDGVGNTSSHAVHKRISSKGYNPSLDSVHRALGRERKK